MRRLIAVLGCAVVLAVGLAAPAAAFTDVPPLSSYATAIGDLSIRGVINGYDDDTFRPEDPVWRQHFAKMIVLTLGLEYEGITTCPFSDVQNTYPYPAGFVAEAFTAGITEGKGPGRFAPTDQISRAQVVTMVVRAAQNLLPGTLKTPPADFESTWGADFDPVHGPTSLVAEYNGLLAGIPLSDGGPWASMPRGEVAQVLHNLLITLDSPPGIPSPPPDIPPPPPDIPPPPPDFPPPPPDFPPPPPDFPPPPLSAGAVSLR